MESVQGEPPQTRRRTRALVETAVVAALYAALTVVLSPVSFGPVQFRLAEMLKAGVIRRPRLIGAIALGTLVGNLASPFVGPWELLFMPATDALGGVIAWAVGRRMPLAGAAAYALTTAASVAFMLWQLGVGPLAALFPGILVSEAVLLVAGLPIMEAVLRRVEGLRGGRQPAGPAGRPS